MQIHLAVGATLGTRRDADLDAIASPNSLGDDVAGSSDDEDGVIFGSLYLGRTDATMTIEVQGATGDVFINAWLDFDGEGYLRWKPT